ncbi:MAG TPA: metallophosphoesterase [Acidimicrobiia bacterium]|nr:metallophosphoesterase [Acidimicrobiia bacterium]
MVRRIALALVILIAPACGSLPVTGSAPGSVASPSTSRVEPTSTTTTTAVATTTPGASAEPWALVVVGDFGDGGEAERAVADAVAAWVLEHPETRALVTTGDNFYTADVAAAWLEPYGWLDGAGLGVWPVPGNHDLETPEQWLANVAAFGSFPRWRTESVGETTLVLLDSNQMGSGEQQAWLERITSDLAGRPWIAVFHHPWVSCSIHGSTPGVDERWGDLLAGATLVLNGHDHNYQRFRTESGWSIVTGGGGRRLYGLTECPPGTPEQVAAAESFHFLTIVGGSGVITVEAHEVDGTVFDSVVVRLGA